MQTRKQRLQNQSVATTPDAVFVLMEPGTFAGSDSPIEKEDQPFD